MEKHSEIPTKIELHRLKHHFNGRTGSLISVSSLSEEEKNKVVDAFLTAMILRPFDDRKKICADVLADWGMAQENWMIQPFGII